MVLGHVWLLQGGYPQWESDVQYSAWAEPTSETATRTSRPNTRQRPDRFHARILQREARSTACVRAVSRHSACTARLFSLLSRLRAIRPLLLRPRF